MLDYSDNMHSLDSFTHLDLHTLAWNLYFQKGLGSNLKDQPLQSLFKVEVQRLIANQKWRPATRPRLMIPCAWSYSPLPVPLSSAANERPEAFFEDRTIPF